MCGICGVLYRDPERPVEQALLERLNATLNHRGPDSAGFLVQGALGMAMRRLAIIDVRGGHQPVFNEDGTIALVFNGEIYNFQELREALRTCGHRFASDSDTEVIVHAYEEWGDAMLLRLKGMFAVALWDGRRRRLLLARDRMGEKPLYWHDSDHGLVWGSEAKAVLAAPWVERRIDPVALHHYLSLQYTPDPLTIYADIKQLPAAHKLVVEDGKPPRIERWWQLQFEPKEELSDADAIEQARALLTAAVERQLISEVPLGAFLSGGIDSSIIVALMAERTREPVRTFSIGFVERHFSEVGYARQLAERYGTHHYEFIFRPEDLVRVIEGVAAAADEPFADPAALPLYELARQTSQHVTVALSGDGGDETLAGYRRYLLDGWLRPYAALPNWITQQAIPGMAAMIPEPAWLPEDRNPITGLKRLGHFASVTHKASLVRWGSYFNHAEKLALYHERWREEPGARDSAAWLAAAYDAAQARSQLDRTLAADHATYLAGDLLPKTDRMTMAHSIEARAPFLDVDWVTWTAQLPRRYKIRGGTTKWLLKAAFGATLPPAIAARGKQGFGVPISHWLRNDLCTWARERLLGNPALDEWFQPMAVQTLFEDHCAGRANHGKKLWALLMFGLWAEQRMQGGVHA
ncbi:asparagine synthase (glutamine-hydrolyzing) [Candidatus Chloroploca asiatica]|uniref:asparagine synthase (glutamine-hydrolyzing) n=1 Tax=Candidatus Chloroploca asiatica TaxID=1506545 RepID=A0A2H3KQN6_9CHLR|nr:asparagine synthase (glutamine-hydrolyzing) [Candidatus Chloroploca asiatica]PDV99801.1 asparagine synthase (glutamine-hydrolyzing) [Candidatus Chloroploca asiatica]